MRFSVFISKLL